MLFNMEEYKYVYAVYAFSLQHYGAVVWAAGRASVVVRW